MHEPMNGTINNPINNPIYSAKRRQKAREENLAFIRNNPILRKRNPFTCQEEVEVKTEEILTKERAELQNMSIMTAVEEEHYTVYTGTTKVTLQDEGFRWITARGFHLPEGGEYRGQRNIPVLWWQEFGTKKIRTITMKEASDILEFKTVLVYSSKLRFNACKIEDAIQRRLQKFKIGRQRCHKYVAKGAQYDNAESLAPHFLMKTFIAFAPTSIFNKTYRVDGKKLRVVVIPGINSLRDDRWEISFKKSFQDNNSEIEDLNELIALKEGLNDIEDEDDFVVEEMDDMSSDFLFNEEEQKLISDEPKKKWKRLSKRNQGLEESVDSDSDLDIFDF